MPRHRRNQEDLTAALAEPDRMEEMLELTPALRDRTRVEYQTTPPIGAMAGGVATMAPRTTHARTGAPGPGQTRVPRAGATAPGAPAPTRMPPGGAPTPTAAPGATGTQASATAARTATQAGRLARWGSRAARLGKWGLISEAGGQLGTRGVGAFHEGTGRQTDQFGHGVGGALRAFGTMQDNQFHAREAAARGEVIQQVAGREAEMWEQARGIDPNIDNPDIWDEESLSELYNYMMHFGELPDNFAEVGAMLAGQIPGEEEPGVPGEAPQPGAQQPGVDVSGLPVEPAGRGQTEGPPRPDDIQRVMMGAQTGEVSLQEMLTTEGVPDPEKISRFSKAMNKLNSVLQEPAMWQFLGQMGMAFGQGYPGSPGTILGQQAVGMAQAESEARAMRQALAGTDPEEIDFGVASPEGIRAVSDQVQRTRDASRLERETSVRERAQTAQDRHMRAQIDIAQQNFGLADERLDLDWFRAIGELHWRMAGLQAGADEDRDDVSATAHGTAVKLAGSHFERVAREYIARNADRFGLRDLADIRRALSDNHGNLDPMAVRSYLPPQAQQEFDRMTVQLGGSIERSFRNIDAPAGELDIAPSYPDMASPEEARQLGEGIPFTVRGGTDVWMVIGGEEIKLSGSWQQPEQQGRGRRTGR